VSALLPEIQRETAYIANRHCISPFISKDARNQPTPYARIGKFLGLSKGAIEYHKRIWKLQADEIRHAGWPAAFSPEQLDQIVFYYKR
jgi:hypothetical protein